MSSLRLHLLAAVLVLAAPLAARAQQAGEPGIPAASAAARIQPGDQVSLRIWNEPEMSDTFHVAETGEVVLPKLGVVRVTDLSASAARDSLQRAYAEFLRNPSVEVTVLRRVGVQGEVRKPDLYLVDLTMTLRDVIARAGGITEYGNPRRIEIVRGGERIPIGEGEGSRFLAAELRSGDQVLVGRRSWFELNSLAIASTAAVVVSVVVPLIRSAF